MNKQHVQVPKMDLTEQGLTTLDPYIYACIKKYMNSKTQQAFPSNSTLQHVSGLGNKTIIQSIKRLEKAGYISITREFGKSNVYTFNDYKKFEICSYDLLDRTDLTPKEKAYFIAAQPYMFKDTQSGYITFNSEKLASSIGLSLNTLKKYESSLCQKNMIQLVPVRTNNATGLTEYNRVYDFEQWSNVIALKFQEQDERINDHDHQINRLKDEIEFLKQELRKVKKEQLEEVKITL